MIRGMKKEAVPYVLEEDRANSTEEQTVFHIKPKKGHDANKTVKRYGGASREGRGGYREFNLSKLDAADVEEFLDIVIKIERYGFSNDHPMFVKYTDGVISSTGDPEILAAICGDLAPSHLNEIFDVAGDHLKLSAGMFLGSTKSKK